MRLSREQFAYAEAAEARRSLRVGLESFEEDLAPNDPALAAKVRGYREAQDWSMWDRIVTLTSNGAYQRALLALSLNSGIDFTTDPNFDYIMGNPVLSGNTRTRHVILMAMSFHRIVEGQA